MLSAGADFTSEHRVAPETLKIYYFSNLIVTDIVVTCACAIDSTCVVYTERITYLGVSE